MAKAGRPEKYTDAELLAWVVKRYREQGEVMDNSYNTEPKKAGGPTFLTVALRLGPTYGSVQNMLLSEGVEPTNYLCSRPVPDKKFPRNPAFSAQDVGFDIPGAEPGQVFRAYQPYEGNLHWRRPADSSSRFLVMDDEEGWIALGLLDPQVEYVRGNSASRIWRVTGTVEYFPPKFHPSIPVGAKAVVHACSSRDQECLWGRLVVTES